MSGKPMQIFLDANALIYLLEGNSAIAERTRATLAGIRQRHPHASLAISELSCLECRVKPLRENDKSLLARYDGFSLNPICFVSNWIWPSLSGQPCCVPDTA